MITPEEVEQERRVVDVILLGQRLVTLLETGRRVSTYKLAALMALIDYCLEHVPTDAPASVGVPIRDLAARVIELYWPQVRPYGDKGRLRQNEQPGDGIPEIVAGLREVASQHGLWTAAAVAERLREPHKQCERRVAQILAQQPLTALQRPGAAGPISASPLLFDSSWLHKHVTIRELADHGWAIHLLPGVAAGLAALAGLLRPTIELLWATDVAHLNRARLDTEDIAGFLFGADRTALARIANGLLELGHRECFYCGTRVTRATLHVDHVLPFSRLSLDGLANLVASDERCNIAKAATLPAVHHLSKALKRSEEALEALASKTNWPVLFPRLRAAAQGLYLSTPRGTALWSRPGAYEPLDPNAVWCVLKECTL